MDEETLYQLILQALAERQADMDARGGGFPTRIVQTIWGPVEVIDDVGASASPYAPDLDQYIEDYYTLAAQDVANANTSGAATINGNPQTFAEMATISGDPYISEAFMQEHGPWMDRWTAAPTGMQSGELSWDSTSGEMLPGTQPPIRWEDGSVTPGDVPFDLQTQLVAQPFRQYPADDMAVTAVPVAMAQLQAALEASQANPNRVPGDVDMRTSMGYGEPLRELARGFDKYSRGEFYPSPDAGDGPFQLSAVTPSLGRGIDEILRMSQIQSTTRREPRENPATVRNVMTALGRGLEEAMKTSVAQERTVREARSAPATQRNTYTPAAAPVYQPVAQRPAAQQITHYATAPRPSSFATSLRAALPGLATARNSLRR